MSRPVFNPNIEGLAGFHSDGNSHTTQNFLLAQRKSSAELFEQLLLFDKVAIQILPPDSYGLSMLIKLFGTIRLSELINRGIIQPVLWKGVVIYSPNGNLNLSTGNWGDSHVDPEENIYTALNRFTQISRDEKRSFNRQVRDKFISASTHAPIDSGKFILDAYRSGNLADFGLSGDKSENDLTELERKNLSSLALSAVESTIISRNNFISFESERYNKLTQIGLKNVESALTVTKNTEQILKIENLPNLQQFYLENDLAFEQALKLRNKRAVKSFRKWIETASKDHDCTQISEEYINEIAGDNSFFSSRKGKLLKNFSLYGLGLGLGAAVAGIGGAVTGGMISKALDVSLNAVDACFLDNLLHGWSPRSFVNELKTLKQGKEPD